ncbi:proprotein convertase subtilisin/kexin type 5-like [Culex pipiens pallens]|uniref:proprotein convertase subtilisin/kexin type 5-like n=1 Tax=Culex pipiens pallens TaxID=42434 RepID=UPI0019543985|nr:proprotein convertase subtilisin/kexin type 5-like [Culex pipiens pallens]
MVRQNWILLAVVGAVLIYEASGLNCVVCNSQEANCVDGSKPSQACEAGVISCYLRTNGANIERGCLTDAQPNCPADEGSTCIKCTSDDCNNQQLQWLQCHKCATTDATCSDAKLGTGSFCTTFKTNDRCYERFVADKVERGCQSEVIPPTDDVCQNNAQCKPCDENNCNSDEGRMFQVTKCVQCDTSVDNTGTCLDGTLAASNCANPSDGKCFTKILDDGSLQRGCHSELTAQEVTDCTGTTCAICTEDNGCNKGIFPADRLQCHQCKKADSASCSDELTTEVNSKICSIYQADDKCYSRVKADQSFDRGCQSDLPANEKSCNGLANCFECDGKNCNSLSEKTLTESTKCQRCTSDDAGCLAGTAPAQSCGQTGDSCFVRINNDGKLERDCLSTLKTDEEKVKCNSDTDNTCIACTEAGCNKQKWLKCHKCDGDACKAAQPGEGEHCTNYKESDKCYERFLDGTDVERGCESDLDPTTENVCVANQQCKTCSDADGCNKDVSTVFEVTKCVQCKSSEDADGSCLKGTKAEEVCANPDGKCYSRIIAGGILERGCRSALTAQEQTACTGELCNLCGDAGCNKGVFPENRLLCYQCKNTNGNDVSCSNELTGDSKAGVCKIYKADDKCYSRVTATLNFERGCQSDLGENAKVCDTLSSCLECDGKNCNSLSEQTLKDSTKCQRCTSDDAGCLAGTAPVQSCGQTGDSCFVRINNDGKLERDCLSTLKTDEEKVKCNSLTDKTCIACTEAGCNKQKWLKCHKCDGDACKAAQPGEGEHCTNYKESDKCYERFLDGTDVERGCESDLDPTTENVCVANQQCKTCSDADGCNKDVSTVFEVTKCVQCKSSEDADGSCLKGTKAEEVCANPDGKCYSRIIAGGILERGCRSALTAQEQTACTGELCNLCGDAGCNKGVFPENRLLCYQCKNTNGNDVSCSNELTGDSKAGVCKIYKADDKCYSRVTATLNFERGCQSDLGDNVNACDALNDCLECDGKNCNSLSEQKLKNRAKCLKCDSEDTSCVDATSEIVSANCDNVEDSCFVRVNNGKLERNCLQTLSEADQAKCKDANDQSCVTCSAQGCNVEKWIKCHQCKESSSSTCNAAQVDGDAQFCANYKVDNQCYERLESEKVVRGCANDLSEAACTNNLECSTCAESACNKAAANSLKTNQRCLQCSTASDEGGLCLAGTAASQACKKESGGKCFNQVQADGQLKRGCQGELTAAEVTACTGDSCKICDTADCNTGLFPANRLKCYQCKSSADVSCTNELQGTDKSLYCKLYVAQDKCYSRDATDKEFERGCQSDLGLNVDACKDLDGKHCKTCDEPDCNAISKIKLNGAGAIALNVVLVVVAAAAAAIAGL